jgi:hypothetical protein
MWVAWSHVFQCSGTVRLVSDRVATPFHAALLLLRDVTADTDVTCSSVGCVIIVTLIGNLLRRNLVTALYVLHCSRLKAIRPEQPTGVPPFLRFQGLCLWRLWSASPSFSVAQFSRWLLRNCSLLKAARPERFPDKMRAGPGVPTLSSI